MSIAITEPVKLVDVADSAVKVTRGAIYESSDLAVVDGAAIFLVGVTSEASGCEEILLMAACWGSDDIDEAHDVGIGVLQSPWSIGLVIMLAAGMLIGSVCREYAVTLGGEEIDGQKMRELFLCVREIT